MYLISFNVLLDESVYSLKYKLTKNIVLHSCKATHTMCDQNQLFQKVKLQSLSSVRVDPRTRC